MADGGVVRTDHQAGGDARIVEGVAGRDRRSLGGSRGRAAAAEDDHAAARGMGRGRAIGVGTRIDDRAVADEDAAVAAADAGRIRPVDDVAAVGLHRKRGVLQEVSRRLEDHARAGAGAGHAGRDRQVAAGRDRDRAAGTYADDGADRAEREGVGIEVIDPADRLRDCARGEGRDVVTDIREGMRAGALQHERGRGDGGGGGGGRSTRRDGQHVRPDVGRRAEGDRAAGDAGVAEGLLRAERAGEGHRAGAGVDRQRARTQQRFLDVAVRGGRGTRKVVPSPVDAGELQHRLAGGIGVRAAGIVRLAGVPVRVGARDGRAAGAGVVLGEELQAFAGVQQAFGADDPAPDLVGADARDALASQPRGVVVRRTDGDHVLQARGDRGEVGGPGRALRARGGGGLRAVPGHVGDDRGIGITRVDGARESRRAAAGLDGEAARVADEQFALDLERAAAGGEGGEGSSGDVDVAAYEHGRSVDRGRRTGTEPEIAAVGGQAARHLDEAHAVMRDRRS